MRPCKQRVIAEVDARNDMGGAEGDLFGLREEVVGIAIEHHPADRCTGTSSSGISLVASNTSKLNFSACCFREDLKPKLPFGIVAGLDGFPQIAAMEVGIGARDFDGFVPDQRMRARQGLPVKLAEGRFALRRSPGGRYARRSLASCGSFAGSRGPT